MRTFLKQLVPFLWHNSKKEEDKKNEKNEGKSLLSDKVWHTDPNDRKQSLFSSALNSHTVGSVLSGNDIRRYRDEMFNIEPLRDYQGGLYSEHYERHMQEVRRQQALQEEEQRQRNIKQYHMERELMAAQANWGISYVTERPRTYASGTSKPKDQERGLYTFEDRLEVGKKGEALFEKYAKASSAVASVENVSEVKQYQKSGIDFIVIKENGTALHIDVKTDTYKPTSFFIETGYKNSDREGCIYSTKADFWFYIFLREIEPEAYWLHIKTVREYMENYGSGYYEQYVENVLPNGEKYTAIGSPIPVCVLPGVTPVRDFPPK